MLENRHELLKNEDRQGEDTMDSILDEYIYEQTHMTLRKSPSYCTQTQFFSLVTKLVTPWKKSNSILMEAGIILMMKSTLQRM